MANDLTDAVRLFEQGGYSCVLCRDGVFHTSTQRGVAPLVGWIDSGLSLEGFSAADKIVGKAAALLFVRLGARAVYAPVMSESAAAVLARFGVQAGYQTLVKTIMNRQGTGSCPMERAVEGIENPEGALEAVRETIKALAAKPSTAG